MISSVAARYRCPIVSHEVESSCYRRLTLHAPEVARVVRAGQFIHLLPRGENSSDPLLRRAFSIMQAKKNEITILYRIEGRGTSLLSQKAVADVVDFIGPLGRCFAPSPHRMILVGGGVGVPPLLMLTRQTREEELAGPKHEITAFVGARSRDDVLCVRDFAKCGVEMQIATDDGSVGTHGYVTQLLEAHLLKIKVGMRKPTQESDTETTDALVYSCGPLPMLKAVAKICAHYEVPCQVSLEENMPCGVGVCNGCVVPVATPSNEYATYSRICVDGPVMWAHDLKW